MPLNSAGESLTRIVSGFLCDVINDGMLYLDLFIKEQSDKNVKVLCAVKYWQKFYIHNSYVDYAFIIIEIFTLYFIAV